MLCACGFRAPKGLTVLVADGASETSSPVAPSCMPSRRGATALPSRLKKPSASKGRLSKVFLARSATHAQKASWFRGVVASRLILESRVVASRLVLESRVSPSTLEAEGALLSRLRRSITPKGRLSRVLRPASIARAFSAVVPGRRCVEARTRIARHALQNNIWRRPAKSPQKAKCFFKRSLGQGLAHSWPPRALWDVAPVRRSCGSGG